MILLLSGGTEIARAMLVERLLKERPSFRHITLEDFEHMPFFQGMEESEQQKMSASLAITCAQEMVDEGFHIVLTHANADALVPDLKEEMEDGKLVTVIIGTAEEVEGFDYSIDTINRSAGDVYVQLEKIIAKATA